jgi:hypothetical protein
MQYMETHDPSVVTVDNRTSCVASETSAGYKDKTVHGGIPLRPPDIGID